MKKYSLVDQLRGRSSGQQEGDTVQNPEGNLDRTGLPYQAPQGKATPRQRVLGERILGGGGKGYFDNPTQPQPNVRPTGSPRPFMEGLRAGKPLGSIRPQEQIIPGFTESFGTGKPPMGKVKVAASRSSFSDQWEIPAQDRGRLGQTAPRGKAKKKKGTVLMVAPNGGNYAVPLDEVDKYIGAGGKLKG